MDDLDIGEVPRCEGFPWSPFVPGDDRNFNQDWWVGRKVPAHATLLRAGLNAAEVARVEMDADPRLVPGAPGPVREIYFIEVSVAHRGCGIGGRVVQRLVERFSDTRLIATTNVAASWWRSLNWTEFNHPEMCGRWMAFISP